VLPLCARRHRRAAAGGVEQSSTLRIRNLILGEPWCRFARREEAAFRYYSIQDFQVE
jgi:hypothetical protein